MTVIVIVGAFALASVLATCAYLLLTDPRREAHEEAEAERAAKEFRQLRQPELHHETPRHAATPPRRAGGKNPGAAGQPDENAGQCAGLTGRAEANLPRVAALGHTPVAAGTARPAATGAHLASDTLEVPLYKDPAGTFGAGWDL